MSFIRISYIIAAIGVIIWGVIDFLEYYEYVKYADSPSWEKPTNEPFISLVKIIAGVIAILVDFWPTSSSKSSKKR